MSKGPGKWQRLILDLVETKKDRQDGRRPGWVYVEDVAGAADVPTNRPLAPAQREAIRRAMRTLAKAGRVEMGYEMSRWLETPERLRVRRFRTRADVHRVREQRRRPVGEEDDGSQWWDRKIREHWAHLIEKPGRRPE